MALGAGVVVYSASRCCSLERRALTREETCVELLAAAERDRASAAPRRLRVSARAARETSLLALSRARCRCPRRRAPRAESARASRGSQEACEAAVTQLFSHVRDASDTPGAVRAAEFEARAQALGRDGDRLVVRAAPRRLRRRRPRGASSRAPPRRDAPDGATACAAARRPTRARAATSARRRSRPQRARARAARPRARGRRRDPPRPPPPFSRRAPPRARARIPDILASAGPPPPRARALARA